MPTIPTRIDPGGGQRPVHHRTPGVEVRRAGDQSQPVAYDGVEPAVVEDERHLVDIPGIRRGDHGPRLDVAEEADLLPDAFVDLAVRANDDHVRGDPLASQLGDRVLGRLGLQLLRCGDVWHEGDVDEHDVLPSDVVPELADGLQEGKALDVTDGPPDLGDHDIDILLANPTYSVLDLIGDVWDHLDRVPQIVPPALLLDHGQIDGPGGDVRSPLQVLTGEPLVMTEVQVGLTTVIGDEHLAVLEGVHRARVDVDVGVELLVHDAEAPRLEQTP